MEKYDVFGIGSPLLDFTVEVKDEFLNELGLKKGEMKLITKEENKGILEKIKEKKMKVSPGGSAANTLAGIACLGGKSVFAGMIGNDSNGEIYEEKTKEEGVFTMLSKNEDELTGNAIVLITPDSERTFLVHLGASVYLRKKNIPKDVLDSSRVLHIEGYLLEDPEIREAVIYSAQLAKENDIKISIDLSDKFLIKRKSLVFRNFVEKYADLVFANESEAEAFTGKSPMQALDEISKFCEIAIVKLGENGSLIKKDSKIYKIQGYKTKVVNTNGAGDMYAAGFLYSFLKNLSLEQAGKIASYSASLVVGKEEARFGKELKENILKFCKDNSIDII